MDNATFTGNVISSNATPGVTGNVITSNVTPTGLDSDLNFQTVVLTMTSLLMSLFITSVNVLTIIVIRKTPFLQTLSNMYVTSLAASDLVVGLGLIPLSVFYIPSMRVKLFDHNIQFCALIFGINLGVSIVSSITMTLIATDRYIYILRPYTYKRVVTKRYVIILVCATWVFGVVYGLLPQLIHNDEASVPNCDITLVMPVGYLFYTNLTIYSILVVLDFVLYSQILYTAYRQRRIIDAVAAPAVSEQASRVAATTASQCLTSDISRSSDHISGISSQTNDPAFINSYEKVSNKFSTDNATPSVTTALRAFYKTHAEFLTAAIKESSENKARRIRTRDNVNTVKGSVITAVPRKKGNLRLKSIKFFLTVFGVYFLCLTPTVVCMGVDYYSPVPRFLYNTFNLLALLNSGINFIIYILLNVRFKIAVMRFLGMSKSTTFNDITDMSNWDI